MEYNHIDAVHAAIKKHEMSTSYRYATYQSGKDFGHTSIYTAKKVYWKDWPAVVLGRQEFNGTPFVVLNKKTYDCQFGKNRKAKRKLKSKASIDNTQNASDLFAKKRVSTFTGLETRKIDCPAKVMVRELCRFPTYQVSLDASYPELESTAEGLLARLQNGEEILYERVFILILPDSSMHTCHKPGESGPENVDPRIAKKIKDMTDAGVRNLEEMKAVLKLYVAEICSPLPDPSSHRFYPRDRIISNHMYVANKRRKRRQMQGSIQSFAHPSVRIKGEEANYNPVQCFDQACVDKSPHMHCPFCVKTESYVDPLILKAHYRVKHVDKGIDFAGLKILCCGDQCDMVGAKKGEKKFKGPHWHCFRCRNGFTRRNEAIKHYNTHYRNPQTTFQIQIAQDINQHVSQHSETEEAAACIPTDSFSAHAGLTDSSIAQTTGMTIFPRGLESMVAMPGVGAVETVGVSDTQTIMIIQDGTDTLASMQEFCASQDSDTPDLSEDVDTNVETVQQLKEKIAQLEKEKAVQTAHIAILSKKIEEQADQIAAYKIREQSLLDQLQQFKQGIAVPQDTTMQDLCNQLETQHKLFIHQQLTLLKQSLVQNPEYSAVPLNFNSVVDKNDVNSGPIQTSISDSNENAPAENIQEKNKNENSKSGNSDYALIVVHSVPEKTVVDNQIVKCDGTMQGGPQAKRRKDK